MRRSAVKTYQKAQRDQLILDHLEYVAHVIRKQLNRLPDGVDLENLEQAGVYGLVEAAEQFDPAKGAAFTTFAFPRILGAVIDELRRNSPLSQEAMRRVSLVQHVLEKHPPPVTEEIIAKETGLTVEQVHSALEALRLTSFGLLDEARDLQASRSSGPQPDEELLREERKQLLANGIRDLPNQERIVLTMYYRDDMRLKEIAEALQLSESRISRVLSSAELRLREYIRSRSD